MANLVRFKFHPRGMSGNRESWARALNDIDNKLRGSKAFEGDYLPKEIEVEYPEGSLFVHVYDCGSVKNGYQEAEVLQLNKEGELLKVSEGFYNWRKDFLSFRDHARELLDKAIKAKEAPKYEHEHLGMLLTMPEVEFLKMQLGGIEAPQAVSIMEKLMEKLKEAQNHQTGVAMRLDYEGAIRAFMTL